MKTLGINCSKSAVFFAETDGFGTTFQIRDTKRVTYTIGTPGDILALRHALHTVLDSAKSNGVRKVAILGCASGAIGSSVEAIKAEGITELLISDLGLDLSRVTPQSLPKALGCRVGEKWQQKSKALFNATGAFPHWVAGTNGAVAAAYKATLP